MPPLLVLLICVTLHLSTLALISIRRSQLSVSPKRQNLAQQQGDHDLQRRSSIPTWTIRLLGLLTALLTLYIPYCFGDLQGLAQCGLRVAAFFYAAKLLDLAVCRSEQPPRLLLQDGHNGRLGARSTLSTLRKHAKYSLLLLTEMRYRSFDIRARQPGRPLQTKGAAFSSSLLPLLGSLAITILLPIAEFRCLTLLLFLCTSLEALHTLLHPTCGHPLFYSPTATPSMADFWSTHWHASASSFLYTLGYRPGKRVAGRAGGVLGAFAVSGAWHGWASAGLVEGDACGAWVVGLAVTGVFVLFAVVILVESLVWSKEGVGWRRDGSWAQRGFIWGVALGGGGLCLRVVGRWVSVPGLT